MAKAAHSHSHDYAPYAGEDRASVLAQAAALAQERSLTFTPQRQAIFELLLDAGRPLGAYSLIEALSEKEGRGIAPPTIYRALDFLVEIGVVSRLESSNEFVPCSHPQDAHDCIFLICTCCKKAVEMDNDAIRTALGRVAAQQGFKTDRQVIEVQGLCRDCQ